MQVILTLNRKNSYHLGDRDALSKAFKDMHSSKKRKLSIESCDSNSSSREENEKGSSSIIDEKKRITNSNSKIYVTVEEYKPKEIVKMTVASVLSIPSMKEKTSLGNRILNFFHLKNRRQTINLVGDQIQKKQMLQDKNVNSLKMNSGRLLQIISDQAINGKNAEVSKAFKVALVII